MKQARIRIAVGQGVLAAIGAALIATGVSLVDKGELIAGGILAGVGAILLVVANYIGR